MNGVFSRVKPRTTGAQPRPDRKGGLVDEPKSRSLTVGPTIFVALLDDRPDPAIIRDPADRGG